SISRAVKWSPFPGGICFLSHRGSRGACCGSACDEQQPPAVLAALSNTFSKFAALFTALRPQRVPGVDMIPFAVQRRAETPHERLTHRGHLQGLLAFSRQAAW